MLQTTYLHAGWEFAQTDLIGRKIGYSRTEWLPAQVPGHVHLDLMANGIIPDPHLQMNEMGVQWVDEVDWSYRTTFAWQPKAGLPRRTLRFDGLDTICEIFLNGTSIARHENMFVPREIDVTESLVEGENTLEVRFESAVRVGRARRQAFLEAEGLPDDVERVLDRSFVRKAQYMFGWDWGPRLVSCGIWQPVRLIEHAGRILDVHVRQRHLDDGTVELTLQSTVEGEGSVSHRLTGIDWPIADGTVTISDPVKWSPENPHRLTLTTTLVHGGETLDARTQPIGLVETRLLREPDAIGESFEFTVNGERLWIRGSNWIPDHSFPPLVDKARLRARLTQAKDTGHNMLRVWGGGFYESDAFYDLCDELGILVWQDFAFACNYVPDDEAAQTVVREEAEVNVRRLRNHPSLALWCGNNENHEMHYNEWGGPGKHPSHYYGIRLYEGVLPAVVTECDPGRSYIASSPIGTPPNEKVVDKKRRGPNADHFGDQHNWDVWHGRGDWRNYTDSRARFSSEYGFASAPSLACYARAFGTVDVDPHAPVVRWHDKTGKGDAVFHGYVELHYPASVTLADWVYYSQLNQRDALRYGIAHYRRSDFCRGSLIWQLNDCWPVQSWAAIDVDGHYKALAYELRRLHDDVLISLERSGETLRVHVVNDGKSAVAGEVIVQASSTLTGEILRTETESVEVSPDARFVAHTFRLVGLAVPETLVTATFAGRHAWQLLGEPKQTRQPAPAKLLISSATEGELSVRVTAPVVDLMLTVAGSPSPFVDNFLTLGPGTHRVRLAGPVGEIEARSLAGHHTVRITRSPI